MISQQNIVEGCGLDSSQTDFSTVLGRGYHRVVYPYGDSQVIKITTAKWTNPLTEWKQEWAFNGWLLRNMGNYHNPLEVYPYPQNRRIWCTVSDRIYGGILGPESLSDTAVKEQVVDFLRLNWKLCRQLLTAVDPFGVNSLSKVFRCRQASELVFENLMLDDGRVKYIDSDVLGLSFCPASRFFQSMVALILVGTATKIALSKLAND